MNIPISSPVAYIGFLLVALGGFMVLAGFGIISVQQVSVRPGRATWVIGLLFAAIGLLLLVPELLPSTQRPSAENQRFEKPAEAPASTTFAGTGVALGAGWSPLDFRTEGEQLWRQPSKGTYSARGSVDTIIWSETSMDGDFEMTVEISSPAAQGEALVIVYGDGQGLSPGCLIFGVANDQQKIMSGTVYEDGSILGVSERAVVFGNSDKSHLMGIRIADRSATLTLDGKDIVTGLLDSSVASQGRIGLYKYGGRPEVTFSDARVRRPAD